MTDKEHNQRISILKAKVSKMRLAAVKKRTIDTDIAEIEKDFDVITDPADAEDNQRQLDRAVAYKKKSKSAAKKKKTKDQDAENEHNRDNYNAQSSVETGGDY